MAKRPLIYCRALVIAHGASEQIIARYIKSRLKLPLEISSRDNGRHSIQINGLVDWLNKQFPTREKFIEEYYNVEFDNGSPVNFVVFPIMDTDDCKPASLANDYRDKSLFAEHWLNPYINPIYNTPSLDDIMVKAEIFTRKPLNNEKTKFYNSIFPIDTKGSAANGKKDIEKFRDKVKQVRDTNLAEFVDYCLSWAENNKVK